MRYTLRQIEYFIATAETGSITLASERVNISQPSISTAIAHLEEELGTQLFVRRHAQGMLDDQGPCPHSAHSRPTSRQSLNLAPRTDSFDEFDGLPLCRGVVDSADSGFLSAVEDLESDAGKVECNGVLVLPSLPIGECDPESRLGHVGSVP